MARVVVIGDVGGHPDQLQGALAEYGPRLPDDVIVVQVGDLVDRGPDSAGVIRLVAAHLRDHPGQWVQLVGNHESQYLPHGTSFWRERLDPADAAILRSWWDDGTMAVAAAIRTADGDDLLATHAGLTVRCWRELGEPATAAEAARLLNDRPWVVWDLDWGPLWADAGWTLHQPWQEFSAAGGLVPFGQIHGHSSIVRYRDQTWSGPGRVRQRATVDWEARHVTVRVGGRLIVGVDPKHGPHGAPRWRPFVLSGATVLAQAGV